MSYAELDAAQPKLTATLDHEGPIPLVEFTVALQRLASRYTRETRAAGEDVDTQLYIAEIRKGSVIVELIAQYPGPAMALAGFTGLGAVAATANHLFKFGENLKGLLNKAKKGEIPPEATKADCRDLEALAAPILVTLNASLTFNPNQPGEEPFGLFTEQEAREVHNRAIMRRKELEAADADTHLGVLMVWDQVRDAPGVEVGRSPDKGIIAAIDKRPKQIRFASDDLKERMGWKGFNPFEKAFVVDVKELIGPTGTMGYTILTLHDVLDRED